MSITCLQLDKRYKEQIVKMKDGNYHKIKEVIGYDLPAGTILVNYTEGGFGWVDIRTEKLYEA